MQYRYVGYTLQGGLFKGRVKADNQAEACGEIADYGYKLLEVSRCRQFPGMEQLFPSLFRIGGKDLVRFTQQLATMVRGGGSLQRAMELLQMESRNRIMRGILTSIIKTLDQGGSLSSAMAQHSNVFGPRYVSVVGAGEHTGRLAPDLDQLATTLEREQDAKQKVKRTMMMPMFTIGAAAVMLLLMLTVLMPPLLKTFERMGNEIPLITRIAMGTMSLATENLKTAGIVIVAVFILLLLAKRVKSIKYGLNLLQIKTPILGQLILANELSQFSRTIGMLLQSGITLGTALPLAITGCKNLTLREAFLAGEESLVSGHGLSAALKEFPVLPRMWVELVTIGEESNSLAQTMTDLADAYQKELENRLGSLLALLEPLSTLGIVTK